MYMMKRSQDTGDYVKKNLHLRDQYKIPLDPNKNPWKPMKVT